MLSIVDQVTHALASKRCDLAKTLLDEALATEQPLATHVELLELKAQTHGELGAHTEAAHTWEQAYKQATTSAEKWRLFGRTRQAYQNVQDYPALHRLALEHLKHSTIVQERATCLLVAGQTAYQLSQYQEARRQYLEPALQLQGVAPETRAHLRHYLGLCAMIEHDFTTAAEAFRLAAGIASSLRLTQPPAPQVGPQRPWDQVVNAALFYQGMIHLIHHRPHQARQMLQRIQHPATSMASLKTDLYLGLACRDLYLPDAADHALHPLLRAQKLPDLIQAPANVICAGVANLKGNPVGAGPYVEGALKAPLTSTTTWEPSWRLLLFQELGLAFQQSGAHHAAIACYEESLKIAAYRMGHWQDTSLRHWLRGASLYIALDNLPLHTWSAVIRGEMVRSLQALARAYALARDATLADTALALALRLAVTPEQRGALWIQRGWLIMMRQELRHDDRTTADAIRTAFLEGVLHARDQVVNTPLASSLSGIAALLQGNEEQALAEFAICPDLPNAPYAQAIGIAAWLWSQARQGGLEVALGQAQTGEPVLWSSQATCTLILEMLALWTAAAGPSPTSIAVSWLGPLLHYDEPQCLMALRRLTQPGYLADPSTQVLTQALRILVTDTPSESIADAVATLLNGDALLARIEARLASLDQLPVSPELPPRKSSRRQKPRRRAPELMGSAPDRSGLRQLIQHLQPDTEAQVFHHLPGMINQWLQRYPQLSANAPEVASALLALLRCCPKPQATIRSILEQVSLSKRQRQGLEATLQTPPPTLDPTPSSELWETLRFGSLTQVLKTVADRYQPALASRDDLTTAREWYALAVALARLSMLSRAIDCTHACLKLAPEQPLPHFLLAQIHRLLQHHHTAWHHTLKAWQGLQTEPVQVMHLEVINQILVLLGTQQDYEHFPEWMATFKRLQAELEVASLTPAQQQRLREETGECALAQVLYLSATVTTKPAEGNVETQLELLSQATTVGTLSTQHFALHRQAEILTQYQRFDEATTAYHQLLHQWPDDQRACLRLSLLTAMQSATSDVAAADQALGGALTLALHGVLDPQLSPLTPQSALAWLQSNPNAPHIDDLSDVLTTCGGIAVERRQVTDALALLEPLYGLQGQPLQAYYLAKAHYIHSQQATVNTDQLCGYERALAYARQAFEGGIHCDAIATLSQQAQAEHDRLTASQEKRANALPAYRKRVCDLFRRYDIPFQEDVHHGAPDAPWLTIAEHLDLDEAGGAPVVTIRLCFNDTATSDSPQPDEPAVRRYATHQHEMHRLEKTYGMSSLPWPAIAYSGETAFEALFSARLGLNRDLLFVTYSAPQALLRYACVLSNMIKQPVSLATDQRSPSASTLSTLARWATVLPFVQDRLQALTTTGTPSKGLRRQLQALEADLPRPSWEAPWQECAVFHDARGYFTTIVSALALELESAPVRPTHVREAPARPNRVPHRKSRSRSSPI